jgi:hypothetical protein
MDDRLTRRSRETFGSIGRYYFKGWMSNSLSMECRSRRGWPQEDRIPATDACGEGKGKIYSKGGWKMYGMVEKKGQDSKCGDTPKYWREKKEAR